MRNARRLALRRETLAALTTEEVARIDAGGIEIPPPTPVVRTLPLNRCLDTFDCVVTLKIDNCYGAI